MTEHRPREIQLTSKQLVFVFMSTVLVAVVVFLLGVWVGRGIGTGSLAATDDVVGKSQAPPAAAGHDAAPPPLSYPDVLQGRPSGAAAPPGGASAAASPPDQPSGLAASSTPPPASPPPPEPAPVEKSPAASRPTTDDDAWAIQVGAYSARAGADKVASEFRGKGYPVTVTPGPQFRVLLGPYPRKAVDQIAARLKKEGQDLRVIRSR